MFVNPSSAFVGKPSVVASSSGRAKKARYARLLPSTRNSSASRAGPSSSCSSAPVSVFGISSNAIVRRRMPGVEIRPFSEEQLDEAAEAEWFDQGLTLHFAQVPASEPALVESWFRLSFGQQQADGIREVPAAIEVRVPEGFEIRRPTADDDVEALLAVELALPRHHRSPPVFTVRPLPTADKLRAE